MILSHKLQKEYEDIVSKGVSSHETSYSVGGEGFLTAVGQNNFPLTQVFYSYIKARTNYPLAIIDLGMTKPQLEWLKNYSDCLVIKPNNTDCKNFPHACGSSYDLRVPFYLSLTPFHRTTCWVASDAVVMKNCTYLFILGGERPTAFRGLRSEVADVEFYNTFRYSASSNNILSSAVFAYNYVRDYEIINKWMDFSRVYAKYPHFRNIVKRPNDSGLLWADLHTEVRCIQDTTTKCAFLGSEIIPWTKGDQDPTIFPLLGIHFSKTAAVFTKKITPWSLWTTSWGDKILPFRPFTTFPSRINV